MFPMTKGLHPHRLISQRQPTCDKWRWFMGKVWPVCG